jgi:hypothetical protein
MGLERDWDKAGTKLGQSWDKAGTKLGQSWKEDVKEIEKEGAGLENEPAQRSKKMGELRAVETGIKSAPMENAYKLHRTSFWKKTQGGRMCVFLFWCLGLVKNTSCVYFWKGSISGHPGNARNGCIALHTLVLEKITIRPFFVFLSSSCVCVYVRVCVCSNVWIRPLLSV